MTMIMVIMIDGDNDDDINKVIEFVTFLSPHPRKYFINLREREKHQCEKHQLVVSHVYPNWGLNLV